MRVSPIVVLLVVLIIVLGFLGARKATAPQIGEEPTGAHSEETEHEQFEFDEVFKSVTDKVQEVGAKTEIYDGVSISNNARIVDLSGQGLTGSLKAEIRFIASVKVLNLSNNQFTGLPAEVGQLSKLETLNLSNNQLTGIPHEIGNLQNLHILDLSGNDISQTDLEVIRERLPNSTTVITD